MRTGVIVEEDEARDTLQRVLIRLEAAFAVDDLRLEDAVHALCNGVVSGLVVLRHTYSDPILLEFVRNQSPWFWEKVHGLKFQLMFREVKIGNGEPQHRAPDAEELAKTAPRGARGGW